MREFRKIGRNSKPQVWLIDLIKDTYIIKWGLLDGAFQETKNTPGNCGDPTHSNYQTAEEYAQFCMDREIREKLEEGYAEYVDGKPTSIVASTIDFSKSLPKNLCFYKPKKEITDKALKQLEKDERAIWTLKRDGLCHISVKSNNIWEIYSRRIDIVTKKFPHIVEALEGLNVPNNSIILGEMCILKDNGTDNFKSATKICRSDIDLALAFQGFCDFPKRKKDEVVIGKACYYVFDIAFWGGEDLITNVCVKDRLAIMKDMFVKLGKLKYVTGRNIGVEWVKKENKIREKMLRENYIGPLKIYKTNSNDDLDLAKELGAEGFVVLDVDAKYGDKAYSFDGKAARPDIWKRKPLYEQEFFITGIYEGITGRNRGKLGGFYIAQIHPITGEQIDCGACGGGFSNEQREEFWGMNLINQTIKVEFSARQPPKDGAYSLRFPEFVDFADKEPSECLAEDLVEDDE